MQITLCDRCGEKLDLKRLYTLKPCDELTLDLCSACYESFGDWRNGFAVKSLREPEVVKG